MRGKKTNYSSSQRRRRIHPSAIATASVAIGLATAVMQLYQPLAWMLPFSLVGLGAGALGLRSHSKGRSILGLLLNVIAIGVGLVRTFGG
jgi:hypothetical protein